MMLEPAPIKGKGREEDSSVGVLKELWGPDWQLPGFGSNLTPQAEGYSLPCLTFPVGLSGQTPLKIEAPNSPAELFSGLWSEEDFSPQPLPVGLSGGDSLAFNLPFPFGGGIAGSVRQEPITYQDILAGMVPYEGIFPSGSAGREEAQGLVTLAIANAVQNGGLVITGNPDRALAVFQQALDQAPIAELQRIALGGGVRRDQLRFNSGSQQSVARQDNPRFTGKGRVLLATLPFLPLLAGCAAGALTPDSNQSTSITPSFTPPTPDTFTTPASLQTPTAELTQPSLSPALCPADIYLNGVFQARGVPQERIPALVGPVLAALGEREGASLFMPDLQENIFFNGGAAVVGQEVSCSDGLVTIGDKWFAHLVQPDGTATTTWIPSEGLPEGSKLVPMLEPDGDIGVGIMEEIPNLAAQAGLTEGTSMMLGVVGVSGSEVSITQFPQLQAKPGSSVFVYQEPNVDSGPPLNPDGTPAEGFGLISENGYRGIALVKGDFTLGLDNRVWAEVSVISPGFSEVLEGYMPVVDMEGQLTVNPEFLAQLDPPQIEQLQGWQADITMKHQVNLTATEEAKASQTALAQPTETPSPTATLKPPTPTPEPTATPKDISPSLKIEGRRFLDRTGTEQILKGAVLVRMVFQGEPRGNLEIFKQELGQLKALGANFVIVQWNSGFINDPNYVESLIRALEYAHSQGFFVELSLHSRGGVSGSSWENIQITQLNQQVVDDWTALLSYAPNVVRRIGDAVDLFGILSEIESSQVSYRDPILMEACQSIRRAIASNDICAFSGPSWGGDARSLVNQPPLGNNIAVEIHPYSAIAGPTGLREYIPIILQGGQLIFVGEMGFLDKVPDGWNNDLVDFLIQQGMSGAFFAVDRFSSDSGHIINRDGVTPMGELARRYFNSN